MRSIRISNDPIVRGNTKGVSHRHLASAEFDRRDAHRLIEIGRVGLIRRARLGATVVLRELEVEIGVRSVTLAGIGTIEFGESTKLPEEIGEPIHRRERITRVR